MESSRFPLARYYKFMFLPGLLLLMVPGLILAYLLAPLPGSQELDSVPTAHALSPWVLPLRIIGLLLVILPLADAIVHGKIWKKIGAVVLVLFCALLTYAATVVFDAPTMFREPEQLILSAAAENKVPMEALVIGVEHNGVARAYPINYLAYHHRVRDTVGGLSVLVTYCSMCRTGEVFRPEVDNRPLTFRLVGANHYNAMFEDEASGSWWYQATGEAIVGPMKGKRLPTVPSEQMTLRAWLERYPASLIMQPDPAAAQAYANTEGYDYHRMTDDPWEPPSWVVGVTLNGESKAYPWSGLVGARVVNDNVGSTPIVVALEADTASFHVWERRVDGETLDFGRDSSGTYLRDAQSGSLWTWNGTCVGGRFTGKKLRSVQASQEYWHSWSNFQPGTKRWEK